MKENKKIVSQCLNKIFFPNINIQTFYKGKNKLNEFIKIKSMPTHSKYDIKVFLYDVYGESFKKMHSKIERVSKKTFNKSKQKKIFWLQKN